MPMSYLTLLLTYAALPRTQADTTIFDVSGYPHYENVCSNVLAFYFDPQREHGLGSLLLDGLLNALNYPQTEPVQLQNIWREYSTLRGGRLDLLIKTDRYLIAIENKIFHGLNNDLNDYRETVQHLADPDVQPIYLVLSPRPLTLPPDSGFQNLTYGQLWQEVKRLLGFYASATTQKWLSYLYDLMTVTTATGNEAMELTEREQFFIEHHPMLVQLQQEYTAFQRKLASQLTQLQQQMDEGIKHLTQLDKRWIYASNCLVHDFVLTGHKIAFDLYIKPDGWTLQLFGRNQTSQQFLGNLIAQRLQTPLVDNNRFVIGTWPLQTPLDPIRDTLSEWMNWLDAQ